MKRATVIYIPKPGEDRFWDDTILSTIRQRHHVHVLDRHQPIEPQFAGKEVVVEMGAEPVPRAWVEAARGAKLWQLMSVGYDKFDVDQVKDIGIPVCNCPGSTTSPGMAETALMLMYLFIKRYNEAQEVLKAGKAFNPMGDELEGRLLGLVGFGASGRATARLAMAAGLRLAIAEPREIEQEALDTFQPEFVVKPDAMERIFAEADIVSLHLPLLPETRGSVNAGLIGRMKPTALFINTARGDIVDQEALYSALLEGRIGGIGTDVHAGVFPDPTHPVYQHPHFYATPHTAGTSRGTARRRAQVALENADLIAAGEPPLSRIDQ